MSASASSRRGLHRHRPPDALPGQVLRSAARRAPAQGVAVVPRRRPGRPARRGRTQHLLRHGPARRRAGAHRRGRRGLRRLPRAGSSATASTALRARVDAPTTPLASSARPTKRCARSARSTPARWARRATSRSTSAWDADGADLAVISAYDPDAMVQHSAECRERGLPLRRRPVPADRPDERRADDRADRGRRPAVHQRLREEPARSPRPAAPRPTCSRWSTSGSPRSGRTASRSSAATSSR